MTVAYVAPLRADEHTPGPWSCRECQDDDVIDIVAPEVRPPEIGEWVPIATIAIGFNEPFETERVANAHLIAAAPDLLAACKDTLAKLEKISWLSDLPFEVRTLRAAIARATPAHPARDGGEG